MNKIIYFDNASSTKIDKEVIKKITKYSKFYGNESSVNKFGKSIKKKINSKKKIISNIMKCENKELFFTSGTTESNNLAINGFLKNRKEYFIITSKIEHSSILEPIKNISNRKFYIKINKDGSYRIKNIIKILKKYRKKNFFISLSLVNNETGIIQNIKKICKILNYKNILHIDASSAFGKIKINLNQNIKMLSISCNKNHGPKGIGLIYIKKNIINKITPIILGGGQQSKIRSGTLPFQLIAGLCESFIISHKNFSFNMKKIKRLKDYFLFKARKLNYLVINNDFKNNIPNIINFYIKKINKHFLIQKLKKFCFSFSSSCNDIRNKISPVLSRMKIGEFGINNSIRLSFSKYNKIFEIKLLFKKIKEIFKSNEKYFF
ncbi:cysteine desulfurase family protein [Candidatus Vidania fulgoroideorum]